MKVILTHEQVDFDGMGSLLAAALLQAGSAYAILPRHINRNGRAFLALYRAEFPFIDLHDLPGEPLEQIMLVDTQSLISIKGAGTHTPVQVIDHHPIRTDLSPEWQVTCEATGACTTLLVEKLQAAAIPLKTLQATLMLLGIYEDTGSLSYQYTTARDLRAAAYLLEQGASLHILAEYLNPPLSAEQQQIYNTLLEKAETLTIHGQKIILSKADARVLTDEISSIAHKLRDLLEPDGLFLLLMTDEGIRLIARSTSDQIDVGAIASQFNGGGHERASAALIKYPEADESQPPEDFIETVYQQLIDLLPRFIHPAITVSQIMSHHPHLIAPETSMQEALQLMQRYGYEGFPVVKDDKIKGLLTRRAVDRASSHKLNLSAASLMDYGQVFVSPSDSLEHLQEVMASTNWGQIPVLDPESRKVIGIVTRTDLLKVLGSQVGSPSQQNLAERLEAALPEHRLELLKKVAGQAAQLHMALYIVGGFVRDLLLDRPSQDFDLVVEGDAIALGRALSAKYGGRLIYHTQFGTAKWQPADATEALDLITARTEYYEHPTALPTVERGNIKLDLHRRDFTINTLALRLDGSHYGELHNYWGGLNDLHQGTVRVLHSLSFVDDPTRLLRAVRFEQRFDFHIDQRTLQLMEEARPLLKEVSGDRLRHELNLMLVEEKSTAMLARLDALGILSAIHADLPWNGEIGSQLPTPISTQTQAEWELPEDINNFLPFCRLSYLVWLGRLPQSAGQSIAGRLKFTANLSTTLAALNALLEELPSLVEARPSQITERFERVPLLGIFAASFIVTQPACQALLQAYVTRWRHITPIHNGNTLKARGLPPSAAYRIILKALKDAWVDGEVRNVEEEETLLQRLIACNQLPGLTK